MKRILLPLALFVVIATATLNVQAQNANILRSTPTHVPTDTVINTGVKYQYSAPIAGYADALTFQFVITKISGTVGGSIVLQGTLDGTNYINIGSAIVPTDVASQSGSFALAVHNYITYRISYTGAGTMSAKLNGFYVVRKRP